ncbi:hypothetical protein B0I35DRAFT_445672 [Stachybotrys elegans]|uniref:Infection structure specific protein n=1 Tax=Stachybotrys elegans TaxID=80388 RepID=A0A8K0SHB1_9HYPO|nr:hypothetical protein B0I35DRAFT_445672 [Stachybotrys elegans]
MKLSDSTLAVAALFALSSAQATGTQHINVVISTINTIQASAGIQRLDRRQWEEVGWNNIPENVVQNVGEQCSTGISVFRELKPAVPTLEYSLADAMNSYLSAHPVDTTAAIAQCLGNIEVTGSLSSDWAEYTSTVSSYMSELASNMGDLVTACRDEEGLTSALMAPFQTMCTAFGEEIMEISGAPAVFRRPGLLIAVAAATVGITAFVL